MQMEKRGSEEKVMGMTRPQEYMNFGQDLNAPMYYNQGILSFLASRELTSDAISPGLFPGAYQNISTPTPTTANHGNNFYPPNVLPSPTNSEMSSNDSSMQDRTLTALSRNPAQWETTIWSCS